MHLLNAFAGMTNDLRYGDCPDRQVDAVLDWEDAVRRAAAAVPSSVPADCEVTFSGAASCRTWRTSCYSILQALAAHAEEAVLRRIEADRSAARHDQAAAAAEADAAAAAAAAGADAFALLAAAAEHREAAAAARYLSRQLMDWQVAAGDAHASGSAMLSDELPRAERVGEAIGRSGGVREVYRDKHWADRGLVAELGEALRTYPAGRGAQ